MVAAWSRYRQFGRHEAYALHACVASPSRGGFAAVWAYERDLQDGSRSEHGIGRIVTATGLRAHRCHCRHIPSARSERAPHRYSGKRSTERTWLTGIRLPPYGKISPCCVTVEVPGSAPDEPPNAPDETKRSYVTYRAAALPGQARVPVKRWLKVAAVRSQRQRP